MKKLLAIGSVIFAALVAGAGTVDSLNENQLDALTTIDTVPTRALYESLPSEAKLDQAQLQAIAADGSASPAYRLRAIHALSTYCVIPAPPAPQTCPDTDPAHQTLAALITANGSAHAGADLLILRGAIEAIGPLRGSNDAATLVPLLDHPSRDIRSTTALALGAVCDNSPTTLQALHQRYSNESTDQVKLAISAALRMLPCP